MFPGKSLGKKSSKYSWQDVGDVLPPSFCTAAESSSATVTVLPFCLSLTGTDRNFCCYFVHSLVPEIASGIQLVLST